MKVIEVHCTQKSYPIYLGKGILEKCHELVNLDRHVFLITDDGVPSEYLEVIKKQCKGVTVQILKQGEESKGFATYQSCLEKMVENNFTRKDCVVALGGGVVGDLAGFVASTYMRGIDFIQIPTTTLSQIDSSIGGKVAINVNGYKNCVGAFWQPTAVIVDYLVLNTLSKRHYYNGLVEALKAGCLDDPKIVALFEEEQIEDHVEEIIERSILFKKRIVEEDETEQGIRKILNFGHTFGHAIESIFELKGFYHGEAVALGMLWVIDNEEIVERLKRIYEKMNLKTDVKVDPELVMSYLLKDKKKNQKGISLIRISKIGEAKIVETSMEECIEIARRMSS